MPTYHTDDEIKNAYIPNTFIERNNGYTGSIAHVKGVPGLRVFDIIQKYMSMYSGTSTNIGNTDLVLTSDRTLYGNNVSFTIQDTLELFLHGNTINIQESSLTYVLTLNSLGGKIGNNGNNGFIGFGNSGFLSGKDAADITILGNTVEINGSKSVIIDTRFSSVDQGQSDTKLLAKQLDIVAETVNINTTSQFRVDAGDDGGINLQGTHEGDAYGLEINPVQEVITLYRAGAGGSQSITMRPSGIVIAGTLKLETPTPVSTGMVWGASDNEGNGHWITIPGFSQVKANWNETDTNSYAFIQNKPALFSGNYNDLSNRPTIPAAQVQSDWNATTGMGVVLNKPTIPAAQIQSDWTQLDTNALDFIKNKPATGLIPVNADWNATSGLAQILNKPARIDYKTTEQAINEKWIDNSTIYQITVVASTGSVNSYVILDLSPNISGGIAEVISIDIKSKVSNLHRSDYGQGTASFNSVGKQLSVSTTSPNTSVICTLKYTKV